MKLYIKSIIAMVAMLLTTSAAVADTNTEEKFVISYQSDGVGCNEGVAGTVVGCRGGLLDVKVDRRVRVAVVAVDDIVAVVGRLEVFVLGQKEAVVTLVYLAVERDFYMVLDIVELLVVVRAEPEEKEVAFLDIDGIR